MPVRKSKRRQLNRRTSGAFTLIEIMVSMVIIAILLTLAVLSLGILGDDDNLNREVRRISSLIELVTDEATTQGRDFGMEFMTAGYRFVEYDPLLDQWFEVIGDDYLVQRNLDEGVEFELFLEERRVLLHIDAQQTEENEDEQESQRDLTDDYIPHVLIMSSGDVTPFELRLVRNADRSEIALTMSLAGELEITSDANENL